MTFREAITHYLTENGLLDGDANEVMNRMMDDEAHKAMMARWDDDMDGYPEPMKAFAIVCAKQAALEWIDVNKPRHWARAMFI